jgi:hypothetical protein
VQTARARREDFVPFETPLAEERESGRWSRRSRFLFIVGAATLCWVVPGVAIYLLVAAH